MSVSIEDIHIHQATVLYPDSIIKIHVSINQVSGLFEISNDEHALLMTGKVTEPSEPLSEQDLDENMLQVNELLETRSGEELQLDAADIYTDTTLRGYEYGPTFRGILSADGSGKLPG